MIYCYSKRLLNYFGSFVFTGISTVYLDDDNTIVR